MGPQRPHWTSEDFLPINHPGHVQLITDFFPGRGRRHGPPLKRKKKLPCCIVANINFNLNEPSHSTVRLSSQKNNYQIRISRVWSFSISKSSIPVPICSGGFSFNSGGKIFPARLKKSQQFLWTPQRGRLLSLMLQSRVRNLSQPFGSETAEWLFLPEEEVVHSTGWDSGKKEENWGGHSRRETLPTSSERTERAGIWKMPFEY